VTLQSQDDVGTTFTVTLARNGGLDPSEQTTKETAAQ